MDKTLFDAWFRADEPPTAHQETTQAMAQRGVAEAQFNLGLRYAIAKGAARDYAQAEHWYLKAAEQKHPLAHFNLGIMHAQGQGMPADRAQSLAWIQKAADLGDAGAQYSLGVTYHRAVLEGEADHASQSRIDAYKWFCLASAQGYQGGETACAMVNIDMTQEDVREGDRRVVAFNARREEQSSRDAREESSRD